MKIDAFRAPGIYSLPVRAVFLFFCFVFSFNGYSQTVTTPIPVLSAVPGTGGNIGLFTKLAVVNGRPAICTYDNVRSSLYYMRATDADGNAWAPSVALDVAGGVGAYLSVEIVNGNPAVAYYDNTNQSLKFVRALDADGAAWGAPLTVDAGGGGQYTSLQIVNGNPAIAYYDIATQNLKYVQAANANGTAWNAPLILDATGNVGPHVSMVVVNGAPAIAYQDASFLDLKFVRAADANGATWNLPQTIESLGSVGYYNSLQIVDGVPAIAYHDLPNNVLKFIKASDVNGAGWSAAQSLDVTGNVASNTSIHIVNGMPAIAYYDGNNTDLKFIRATNAAGTAWGAAQTVHASPGTVGQYASLQVVNGNPAIAYYEFNGSNLKYVRAADANGAAWNTPQTFDARGLEGLYISQKWVNGNPAFSYYDQSNTSLKFVRAANAAGTSWNAPLELDGTTTIAGEYTSLQIVNGKPAISYYDATNQNLVYIHAANADGTAWGLPRVVDGTPGEVGQYSSLQVADGNPAIAYYDVTNTNLKYIRAADADGDTWTNPAVTLDVTAGDVGRHLSLQIVNGNPAISYYDATNGDLKFIRAADVKGNSWTSAVTIDAAGDVGSYTSLCIVNGNPAIAYTDITNGALKFVRATDANGTSWGIPQSIDAISTAGSYACLEIVNGNPAIAYFDSFNSDLKIIRAADASGTSWATPVVLHSADVVGYFPGIISNGTSASIAYYYQTERLPYFVTIDYATLPVTLTSIAAQWKNTSVEINWQVADESNIERYIVERSADGKNFTKIGAVAAVNAVYSHNYNYIDASPLEGMNYYRLRIEEATGTARYSTIVSLRPNSNSGNQVSVYPNPVKNNSLQFEASLPAGEYMFKVVNSAGMEVMSVKYQHAGGTVMNAIPLAQKMTKGVYHLVISGGKLRVTTSFVK